MAVASFISLDGATGLDFHSVFGMKGFCATVSDVTPLLFDVTDGTGCVSGHASSLLP